MKCQIQRLIQLFFLGGHSLRSFSKCELKFPDIHKLQIRTLPKAFHHKLFVFVIEADLCSKYGCPLAPAFFINLQFNDSERIILGTSDPISFQKQYVASDY